MRTQNFQWKLFDIAVTLKYGQGHWKRHGQVIMQSLTFVTVTVSEQIPKLKFSTSQDTWPTEKYVSHLPWLHTRVTQIILCIIFLMSVSTTQCLKLYRTRIQTRILQFIYMSHLWPWKKVTAIKPGMTMWTPSKVITMQSLKDLALMVSEKKPFFLNDEICQLSPLNMCEKQTNKQTNKQKQWHIHGLLDVIRTRT